MLYLIVGSIFAVILVAMVVTASLATVNLAPGPNDLFAVTTPVYRIAFYAALCFMTIDENLIALAIPVVGRWWEALFNLFITTALLTVLVYYLPFQVLLFYIYPHSCVKEMNGALVCSRAHGGFQHVLL